jgi:hypothetical protein
VKTTFPTFYKAVPEGILVSFIQVEVFEIRMCGVKNFFLTPHILIKEKSIYEIEKETSYN